MARNPLHPTVSTQPRESPVYRAWALASVIGVVIWAFLLYYHMIRRDIWNPFAWADLDMFLLANKCFGLTAVWMVSISIAMGPVARFFSTNEPWVYHRRYIGLVSVAFMAFHVTTSLLIKPADWLLTNWLALTAGIIALAIFTLITVQSRFSSIARLGTKRWKTVQRLVYPALALAVLHFLLFGKITGWIAWSKTLSPPIPGGTLLTTAIVLTALLLRLTALLRSE